MAPGGGAGTPLRRLLAAGAAALAALVAAACTGAGDNPTGGSDAPTTVVEDAEPRSGFIAFGDFGGGPAQRDVAAAMEGWAVKHRFDALVTTGDNVYEHGEPELFAAQLDEPYRELRRTRPLWVTLGNHDVQAGHGDEQLAHLGLPALPYARELPGVQLLFLDANRPSEAQARWLAERLAEPGPRFRAVVFHQPAFSCGRNGSTPAVIANWVPVLEEHRVAVVLNGHDHLYQRLVSPAGVTYVVTGGGGRELYELRPPCPEEAELARSAVEHHFVGVEVFERRLELTAVAADGEVLDEAVIER